MYPAQAAQAEYELMLFYFLAKGAKHTSYMPSIFQLYFINIVEILPENW